MISTFKSLFCTQRIVLEDLRHDWGCKDARLEEGRVGMGPVGGVRLFRGDVDGMAHGLVLGYG